MRKFNSKLLDKSLDNIYYYLFEEMRKGFNLIIVNSESEKEKIIIITKFLCIYNFIQIKVKGEIENANT